MNFGGGANCLCCFRRHLIAFESTISFIRELWTMTFPMVVHGFMSMGTAQKLLDGTVPDGSYFFRLSNSEPDKIVVCVRKGSKGIQVKHPAFSSLADFQKFIRSKGESMKCVLVAGKNGEALHTVSNQELFARLSKQYVKTVDAHYRCFIDLYTSPNHSFEEMKGSSASSSSGASPAAATTSEVVAKSAAAAAGRQQYTIYSSASSRTNNNILAASQPTSAAATSAAPVSQEYYQGTDITRSHA